VVRLELAARTQTVAVHSFRESPEVFILRERNGIALGTKPTEARCPIEAFSPGPKPGRASLFGELAERKKPDSNTLLRRGEA
jgi:hypothetical protein